MSHEHISLLNALSRSDCRLRMTDYPRPEYAFVLERCGYFVRYVLLSAIAWLQDRGHLDSHYRPIKETMR